MEVIQSAASGSQENISDSAEDPLMTNQFDSQCALF